MIITVTLGPFCVWVVFFSSADAAHKEWASGVVGGIVAYWFR